MVVEELGHCRTMRASKEGANEDMDDGTRKDDRDVEGR